MPATNQTSRMPQPTYLLGLSTWTNTARIAISSPSIAAGRMNQTRYSGMPELVRAVDKLIDDAGQRRGDVDDQQHQEDREDLRHRHHPARNRGGIDHLVDLAVAFAPHQLAAVEGRDHQQEDRRSRPRRRSPSPPGSDDRTSRKPSREPQHHRGERRSRARSGRSGRGWSAPAALRSAAAP